MRPQSPGSSALDTVATSNRPNRQTSGSAGVQVMGSSSTQGTMTTPEAMRLRAISAFETGGLSQTFLNQGRSEIQFIS